MNGGEVVLAAKDLSVMRAGRQVLHEINLSLHRGELLAVMGPNGAGKSTLLETLAGTVAPSQGLVERSGRVALALQTSDLARRSVTANVTLALAWWGVPRAERAGRARDALQAMGALHLSDREAAGLSGGERQRVHLARALAVRPEVLMLDEPFAGLDAVTRAELLDDTGAGLRDAAAAAVVVVHDRAEAWALADRLAILIDGRLVAQGSPRELFEQPPTLEVARFLGFDGTLHGSDGRITVTRPQHVILDPQGDQSATVKRAIPLEDGVRLELDTGAGTLFCNTGLPGPRNGDQVSVRLHGGVGFAADPADRPQPRGAAQGVTNVPETPVQARRP